MSPSRLDRLVADKPIKFTRSRRLAREAGTANTGTSEAVRGSASLVLNRRLTASPVVRLPQASRGIGACLTPLPGSHPPDVSIASRRCLLVRGASSCDPARRCVPRSSTTRRSIRRTVESRCAMTIAVRLAISVHRASWISVSLSESSELVASSRMRIGASLRMARAIAMRWRCPPDSFTPRSPTSVSVSPGKRLDEFRLRAQGARLGAPRRRSPRADQSGCCPRWCGGTSTDPAARRRSPRAAPPAAHDRSAGRR